MVFAGLVYPDRWLTQGARVMTTTYPIKAPIYAITKGHELPPQRVDADGGKGSRLDTGVFIDADGYVGEGSNMNVAFVTNDAVLVHPTFDHILAGCTSAADAGSSQQLLDRGMLKGIELRDVSVPEARAAREMLLMGSS
jgi:4-amino-4-deoxychorismate lyase